MKADLEMALYLHNSLSTDTRNIAISISEEK